MGEALGPPLPPDRIYEANQIFALQLVVIGGLQVESVRDMTLLEIIDNDGKCSKYEVSLS